MSVAFIHHEERDKILPLCAALTPLVEPYQDAGIFLGLDAAGSEKFTASAIFKKERWGLAASKFTARVACLVAEERNREPSGGLRLHRQEEAAFLAPLPVDYFWPLSRLIIEHLKILGLRRIGEVAAISKEELCLQFGEEEGSEIFNYSRGIDLRPVLAKYPPDSLELERKIGGALNDGAINDGAINEGAINKGAIIGGALNDGVFNEGAINKEGLRIILNELLAAMSKELKLRGQALQTLSVELIEESGNTTAITRSFVQPVSVFTPGLAENLAVHLKARSPVVSIKLIAGSLKPAQFTQCTLWEDCLFTGQRNSTGTGGGNGLLGNSDHRNSPGIGNSRNRADNSDNVQCLVASVQKLLPHQRIFFGSELQPSRREKALSLWDPFRFPKTKNGEPPT